MKKALKIVGLVIGGGIALVLVIMEDICLYFTRKGLHDD